MTEVSPSSESSRFDAAARLAGRVPWWLVVALVALGVRLYQLGSESLWIDEALSFARSSKPFPELLADSIRRKHLPTYFLLLKFAIQFGDSETALRMPSVVFGTASAVLVYGAARVLAGSVAGVVAGMLVALSRQQVHHGQEARMYTLFTCAVGVALLGVAWWFSDPERASRSLAATWRAARSAAEPSERGALRRVLAGFACVVLGTTLALYSHNTAVFFLAALNLAGLALIAAAPRGSRRAMLRNWVIAMLCVAALWAFWLPTLFGQSATMETTWHGRAAIPSWVGLVLSELFLLAPRVDPLSVLLVLLGGYALYALRGRKPLALALLALACVGPLCAWIVSQKVPMFYHRTLLWAPLAWFVLVGIGVAALPRALVPIAVGALVVTAIPQLRDYYAAETKPGWRPLLQQLVAETDEHSLIVSARAERFLSYYFGRKSDPLPARSWKPVRPGNVERIVGDAPEFYLVGQTEERPFKNVRAAIAATGRYRVRATQRDQNAIVIKYKRIK